MFQLCSRVFELPFGLTSVTGLVVLASRCQSIKRLEVTSEWRTYWIWIHSNHSLDTTAVEHAVELCIWIHLLLENCVSFVSVILPDLWVWWRWVRGRGRAGPCAGEGGGLCSSSPEKLLLLVPDWLKGRRPTGIFLSKHQVRLRWATGARFTQVFTLTGPPFSLCVYVYVTRWKGSES